jgi:hypothetical protein
LRREGVRELGGAGLERDHSEYLLLMPTRNGREPFRKYQIKLMGMFEATLKIPNQPTPAF